MPNSLHSIAYFSRNACPAGVGLDAEIAEILVSARRNNERAGVTGALLFSAGCFAQVLEGPQDAVEAIFETIQCDPRHVNVTVLHYRTIAARSFGPWSMAYAGDGGEGGTGVQGILQAPDAIARGDAGNELIHILQSLVERHDANTRPAARSALQ